MDIPKVNISNINRSPLTFLKEVKSELEKVTWPSKNELIKMTSIVFGVSLVTGSIITGLDFIITKTMALLLKK